MIAEKDSWQSNEEWLQGFREKASQQRIPVSGMLELTSRCNLRCAHCYLGDQQQQHKKRSMEMTTEQVMGVIDEMVAAGCMFLTITGGDPMMRKDFPEIYTHAKKSGLLTSVFCDGILVTKKIIELFKRWPPNEVEISLYGATRATYEKITRVPGSYEKCLRGIRSLLDNGIITKLKTVHMSLNSHEMEAMERMAKEEFGVPFRFDAAIFPCLPSNSTRAESMEPLDLRVTPERAIEVEMRDPARTKQWVDYYEKRKDSPAGEKLYTCGAAVTGFYVDPFGDLSPCLMTTNYKYSLQKASFHDLWHKDLPNIREQKARAESNYGCNTCGMRNTCTGCSAFHRLESGHEDIKSDYVCSQTALRFKKIQAFIEQRNQQAERAHE